MVTPDLSAIRDIYPFASHFADINGHRLHYVDEGPRTGRVIVMVHGNPTWSFYYRDLIKHFAALGYRVIAPDHIGCGLSDKPPKKAYGYTLKNRTDDFAALLAQLEPQQKIILVMHDWGGMIATRYATQNPAKIAAMVVLNTAAFTKPPDKPLPMRLKLIRHLWPLGKPMVLGLNAFARCATFMAVTRPLPKQTRHGLLLPYNSWANRIATYEFVRDIPLRPRDSAYALVQETEAGLARLKDVPMQIYWGLRDFVFDADYLALWEKHFPDAQVRRYADKGHYIVEEALPDIIAGMQELLETNKL